MSARIETKIWLALKNHIDKLPYSKAYPAQKNELPFSGNNLEPYLRIGKVSAGPSRVLLDNNKPHDRRGFLIITLVYPLGQNLAVYENVAASIAEHFKDGTRLACDGICVSITSYPYVQDGYEDKGYWTVPVRIPWRCFA